MKRDEFVAELVRLGFSSNDGEDFTRGHSPMYYVHINGDNRTAWSSYNWGGDTGPIELTDPESAPFDVVLATLASVVAP